MKKIYILLLFCTGTLFSQINLNSGLTACYPFSGNTVDQTSALNGVVNGSVTLTNGRLGNPNDAYQFPGLGTSYIELPNNLLIQPTNYISFAAWVKPMLVSAPTQYILFTKNPGTSEFEAYALTLSYSGQFTAVKSYTNGVTKEATYTTPVVAGTWYHVAMAIGNDSLKLWVNGSLVATNTVTFSFNYQAGKKVYLGSSNENTYYSPFTGIIDNPRFYNRKLNGAEVNSLYITDPGCSAQGIHDLTNNLDAISIYPNPSIGNFFIKNLNTNSLQIFDILGKKVSYNSEAVNDDTNCISLKSKGIYFVRIGEGKTFKIVIE